VLLRLAILVPLLALAASSSPTEGEISVKDLEYVKSQAVWRDFKPIEGAKPVKESTGWIGVAVESGSTCRVFFYIKPSGSIPFITVTNKNNLLVGDRVNPFALRDDPNLAAKCR
jgi:hypothetical protein